MTDQATSEATRWHVVGDWFDTCSCAIPCPCAFAQSPTYGDCEGMPVWHIREGSFGDVRLDDLNVLMLGSFTGNVWAGERTDPYAAVFVDERADERQRAALGAIFGGEAGGWPARFGERLLRCWWRACTGGRRTRPGRPLRIPGDPRGQFIISGPGCPESIDRQGDIIHGSRRSKYVTSSISAIDASHTSRNSAGGSWRSPARASASEVK